MRLDEGALDPGYFTTNGNQAYTSAIYDSLLTQGVDGKPAPKLATAWKVLEDGKTWELTLRQGVKFQNGDPFTSEDVKFTLERMIRIGKPYGILLKARLDRIEAPEPYKVVLVTKVLYPPFPYELLGGGREYLMMTPKKYIEQIGDANFVKKPIGTGPYKFVERSIGDYYKMEAFPDYWQRVPYAKDLLLKIVPEAVTRLAMLKTGEADIIEGVDTAYVAGVKATPGLKVFECPGANLQFVGFQELLRDTGHPMLKDIRVRRAMAHAVDKQGIIKAVYFGLGDVQRSIFHPQSTGFTYRDDPYPYDLAKAKQLMKEAGYESGFIVDMGIVDSMRTVAEAIAAELRRININIQLVLMDSAVFYGKMGTGAAGTIYLFNWGGDTDGHRLAANAFRPKEPYGTLFPMADDPEVTALIAKESVEMDEKKRIALLEQIDQKVLIEKTFIVPLFETRNYWAAGSRVKAWQEFKPYFPWGPEWETVELTD